MSDDIHSRLELLATLREEKAHVEERIQQVQNEIADLMEGRGNVSVEVDGRKVKRTAYYYERWDKDGLRRAVLDSRLFDRTTGEFVDETPVEKVLHIWNLGVPRKTALTERGLNPDEFCESEFRGWKIDVK